jgi:hypothetical protein
MAWFRNYYRCEECRGEWQDEWSALCDDDCPHCGARHMSPYDSDNATEVIEKRDGQFFVYRSPESAEHDPNYEQIAKFPTLQEAEAYLRLHPTQG